MTKTDVLTTDEPVGVTDSIESPEAIASESADTTKPSRPRRSRRPRVAPEKMPAPEQGIPLSSDTSASLDNVPVHALMESSTKSLPEHPRSETAPALAVPVLPATLPDTSDDPFFSEEGMESLPAKRRRSRRGGRGRKPQSPALAEGSPEAAFSASETAPVIALGPVSEETSPLLSPEPAAKSSRSRRGRRKSTSRPNELTGQLFSSEETDVFGNSPMRDAAIALSREASAAFLRETIRTPDAEETAGSDSATPEEARLSRKSRRSRGRRKNPAAPADGADVFAEATEETPADMDEFSTQTESDTFSESDDDSEISESPEEMSPDSTSAQKKAVGKKGSPPAKSAKEDVRPAKSNAVRRMLVSVLPGDLVEVVLTEDGVVREYYVEMTHQVKIRGNIYKGFINNIDTNLQAAFVNFGGVKNGFLQIDEVHPEYYLQPHDPTKGHKYPPIQKVLKQGQEVLVQVVKEPTGNKGAFLTTWVSLAGRFLVLTPGQEQIGISRKVEDGEERNRLRELIRGIEPGEGLGAIVRTVSEGTNKTTLQKDLSFLKRVWKDIRKRAGTEKAPSLIYQEPGLASRCVRDYLSDEISELWVDDPATADSIREMATLLFPRKADLVRLYENSRETLWEHFKLVQQIEQIHSREVVLPSGGRLVFDQTEALMSIDINSGRIGGKTNFESMAHRTNIEAATAIAQQLRLRDVGGQVVIDFIEMRDQEHCHEAEKTLRNAMKGDRARHDIGKMNSFGLLAIVRQRIGSSAISISMEPCPHCHGTGQRRNLEWQAVQVLRDLSRTMRDAVAAGLSECIFPVDAELGMYLLNHKRERLVALEQDFHVRLDIRISGLSPVPETQPQAQALPGRGYQGNFRQEKNDSGKSDRAKTDNKSDKKA